VFGKVGHPIEIIGEIEQFFSGSVFIALSP
jgi:hypothetical protein